MVYILPDHGGCVKVFDVMICRMKSENCIFLMK